MGYYKRYVAPLVAGFWRTRSMAILYCASAALGIGFLGILMLIGAQNHAGLAFQIVLMVSMPFTVSMTM